jgi:nitrite reductase/ring-hydroxylating ferredoxin subunit
MSETGYRTLGGSADVPEGYVMPYYLEDLKRRVSVARVSGRLYAFDDLSPTDGAPLSSGKLDGTTIMSPCDGARYDLATGNRAGGPAYLPMRTYEVRERDGRIEVRIPGAGV